MSFMHDYTLENFLHSFNEFYYNFNIYTYCSFYLHNIFFYIINFFIAQFEDFSLNNSYLFNFLEIYINFYNENQYTDRLPDFNIFYHSVLLDKILSQNCDYFENFLKITMPHLYVPLMQPELSFIEDSIFADYIQIIGDVSLNFFKLKIVMSFHTLISYYINYIILYYLILILVLLIFSIIPFKSNNKNNLDSEHTSSLILYESEKEIGSIDDILPLLIALVLTFGIYFYLNFFQYFYNYFNNYILTFIVFPVFLVFVFIVPALLLFDFGQYCFVYIRGSGTTSILFAELMYDLINLFAYYIRVTIQCARLILMLTAIASFQELMFYLNFDFYHFIFNDFFYFNDYYLNKYLLFNNFFKILNLICYFLYEIFHAYFVLTIQTIAFFAMVFWLFFYLFSFFVSESFENYFNKRREFFKSINEME